MLGLVVRSGLVADVVVGVIVLDTISNVEDLVVLVAVLGRAILEEWV